MKFSLLGVFIAIVAATTPCFHTNQELWNELTSTLPALCAAHGNTLLADRVTDVYPYVGPEPISLPVVHVFRTPPPPPRDDVSNAGAASVVMILCGFEARGFVNHRHLHVLIAASCCSRQLLSAASENREFVVFPYVNERGRELIMELWPEMPPILAQLQ